MRRAKWQSGKGVKNLHGTCEQSEQRTDRAYKTSSALQPFEQVFPEPALESLDLHIALSFCSLGEVSAGLLGCVDSSRRRNIFHPARPALLWNRECCRESARLDELIWLLGAVP